MNGKGQLLNGRYRFLRKQAADDAAVTWEAQDTLLSRAVAVQLMNPAMADDRQACERFQAEVRTAAGLVDPAILPVYDVGQDAETGAPFIVTPLVEGESLAHRLREETHLPDTTIRAIGRVVAGGLEHAHRQGVVHGDIRPQHILLAADGRPRLAGFGTGRARTGAARYMAPELAHGQPATPSADVYSLGAVLYEMAVGRVSADAGLDRPPPRALNPGLAPDLEAAIVRALAQRPEDRFPTAGELQRALGPPSSVGSSPAAPSASGPAAYAAPVSAAPSPPGRRPRPAPRQLEHHRAVGLAGLVGIFLTVLVIAAQAFGPPRFLDERGGLTIGVPIVAAIPTPTPRAPSAAESAPAASPGSAAPAPTATLIPPPPAGPAAAAPAELDPAETIRLHYGFIDARRYDEGYALMSARLRAQHSPETYRGWFANKVSLRAVSVAVLSEDGDSAVVESEVETADRVGDRTVERRVRERFGMVLEDGGWRIDQVTPL